MQLTILKWTMVVPILLRILCTHADHRSSNTCLKAKSNLAHHFDEKPLADTPRHRKSVRSVDRRKIHRRSNSHSSLQDLDSELMAQNLAKETLRSPVVQEKIWELSNVKRKKNPFEIARVSPSKGASKGNGRVKSSQRHRKRRKKKRKNQQKLPIEPIRQQGVAAEGGAPKRALGARKHVHAEAAPEIVKYNDNINSRSDDSGLKAAKKEASDPNALNADVLKDILANRIQAKLRESETRRVRDALDNSSLYSDETAGSVEDFSPDSLLDDPLSNDNVGGITTEQMLITDITARHFDPVTVAELPAGNLDLSDEEKFSNDPATGSLQYNSPISNTKLQSKLDNTEIARGQDKKNRVPLKGLSEVSTESFDATLINAPIPRDFEPPPIHLPNPMDQPLGKVLESLGIDVNANLKESGNTASPVVVHYPRKWENEKMALSHHLPGESAEKPMTLTVHTARENYGDADSERPSPNTVQVFNDDGYSEEEKESTESTTETYEKTEYPKSSHPPYKNQTLPPVSSSSPGAGSQAKEVAHEILDQIMSEIHELKSNRSKPNNEGSPCRLTGSWLTSQAGLRFDMSVSNRSISVEVSKSRVKAALLEIPVNSTWKLSGHAPFKVGAPFTLMATDNSTKSIAVFVGSCRVCQGVDTISGIWSISRQPTDCRDFYISTSVFSDLFRRIRQPSHGKENQVTTGSTKSTDSGEQTSKG